MYLNIIIRVIPSSMLWYHRWRLFIMVDLLDRRSQRWPWTWKDDGTVEFNGRQRMAKPLLFSRWTAVCSTVSEMPTYFLTFDRTSRISPNFKSQLDAYNLTVDQITTMLTNAGGDLGGYYGIPMSIKIETSIPKYFMSKPLVVPLLTIASASFRRAFQFCTFTMMTTSWVCCLLLRLLIWVHPSQRDKLYIYIMVWKVLSHTWGGTFRSWINEHHRPIWSFEICDRMSPILY